ncbi:hypothetical protein JCGZ_05199 [Jatropha curcas]|uniref:Aminotransferase-like plant mobile domain-containing protein n=1 Tax=Jatropha curcas TaxID=180498 RepID=A0A067KTN3_JATCU|nr:hypothetical protein JCGZ_05199 [Jatropha curcas]
MLGLRPQLTLERRGTRQGSGEFNWQFLHPLEVWAYEYWIYPGGPDSDALTETRQIPQYLVHCYHINTISEDPYHWQRYLNDRALADVTLSDSIGGSAWTAYAPRVRAEVLTRSRVLLHGYWVDRMAPEDRLLEYGGFPADDYLVPGDYASYLSTQDRRRHRTPAFYEAHAEVGAPTGPTGVVLGDVPFPPGMEVTLDPTLGLRPTLAIPADLRQAPP